MSSSLRQRVISAIIIGIPILLLVFYSDTSRLVFLLLLALAVSTEYLNLFFKKFYSSGKAILSMFLCIMLMVIAYQKPELLLNYLIIASLLVNCILLYDLFYNESSIHHSAPWLWNVLYTTLPLSCFIAFMINPAFSSILISILLLIWISDIGAYFVGKSTGKRKLFQRISPGKTWEGFYGAGVLTLIFSYFFFSYFGSFGLSMWAVIALSIWLFGSLGDLVESKIKRSLNIKDSSNIIPGHGGFLDRFDSFIFCIPFVLAIVQFLN